MRPRRDRALARILRRTSAPGTHRVRARLQEIIVKRQRMGHLIMRREERLAPKGKSRYSRWRPVAASSVLTGGAIAESSYTTSVCRCVGTRVTSVSVPSFVLLRSVQPGGDAKPVGAGLGAPCGRHQRRMRTRCRRRGEARPAKVKSGRLAGPSPVHPTAKKGFAPWGCTTPAELSHPLWRLSVPQR